MPRNINQLVPFDYNELKAIQTDLNLCLTYLHQYMIGRAVNTDTRPIIRLTGHLDNVIGTLDDYLSKRSSWTSDMIDDPDDDSRDRDLFPVVGDGDQPSAGPPRQDSLSSPSPQNVPKNLPNLKDVQ